MLNRCQIDPSKGEGEVDSRVGSGGPVLNKPLTRKGKGKGKPQPKRAAAVANPQG